MNERDLRAGEIYQWLEKASIMILEYLEQNTDARLREAEAKVGARGGSRAVQLSYEYRRKYPADTKDEEPK